MMGSRERQVDNLSIFYEIILEELLHALTRGIKARDRRMDGQTDNVRGRDPDMAKYMKNITD